VTTVNSKVFDESGRQPTRTSRAVEFTYFLLRVVSGFLFFQTGGLILFGWFGGMPGQSSPPPLMSQTGVGGVLEFFGGVAIMLGVFSLFNAYQSTTARQCWECAPTTAGAASPHEGHVPGAKAGADPDWAFCHDVPVPWRDLVRRCLDLDVPAPPDRPSRTQQLHCACRCIRRKTRAAQPRRASQPVAYASACVSVRQTDHRRMKDSCRGRT